MDNNAKVIKFQQNIETKEDVINYLKSTDRIDYDALINVFKSNLLKFLYIKKLVLIYVLR